jgi:hypothetical protein
MQAPNQAASEFVALGDRVRADEALALRASIDERQRGVGILLLIFGVGAVFVSVARWLTVRDVEVW